MWVGSTYKEFTLFSPFFHHFTTLEGWHKALCGKWMRKFLSSIKLWFMEHLDLQRSIPSIRKSYRWFWSEKVNSNNWNWRGSNEAEETRLPSSESSWRRKFGQGKDSNGTRRVASARRNRWVPKNLKLDVRLVSISHPIFLRELSVVITAIKVIQNPSRASLHLKWDRKNMLSINFVSLSLALCRHFLHIKNVYFSKF